MNLNQFGTATSGTWNRFNRFLFAELVRSRSSTNYINALGDST